MGPAPMPTVGIPARRDLLGEIAWHHLQHHRERARLLHRVASASSFSALSPRSAPGSRQAGARRGVNPTWAITGTLASVTLRICLATRTPPSNLTA
jgi:hypothetical protein